MRFRKFSKIKLTRDQQAEIFYSLKNWKDKPKPEQQRMRKLCEEIGGPYEQALWRMLTTHDSVAMIEMEFFVSKSELYRRRKRYFEEFFRRERS